LKDYRVEVHYVKCWICCAC